jgi:hypothetical protein
MNTTSRLGAIALAFSITIGGAAVTVPAATAHSTGLSFRFKL